MIKFHIKSLRDNKEMSQKELIKLSGIRANTLSLYENSSAKTISIKHIDQLCEIFNCQPSNIMTYIPPSVDSNKSDDR